MTPTERVNALEGLLERIRRNAALPRSPRAAIAIARPPTPPPLPREEPELLDDALLESIPPPTVKPDGNERPEPVATKARRGFDEEETTLVRRMPIDLEALAAAEAEDSSPAVEVDFDDLEPPDFGDDRMTGAPALAAEETARLEAERIAAEELAEAERFEAEMAEAERRAAERKAAENAGLEKAGGENAEVDRLAAAKRAAAERAAEEKAEAEKKARESEAAKKAEADRHAAEKAAADRLAAAKQAAAERAAAEKAVADRLAAEKAAADKAAADKAAADKAAADKAAADKAAAAKAEAEKAAAARAEAARIAEDAYRIAEELAAAERAAALRAQTEAAETQKDEEEASPISSRQPKQDEYPDDGFAELEDDDRPPESGEVASQRKPAIHDEPTLVAGLAWEDEEPEKEPTSELRGPRGTIPVPAPPDVSPEGRASRPDRSLEAHEARVAPEPPPAPASAPAPLGTAPVLVEVTADVVRRAPVFGNAAKFVGAVRTYRPASFGDLLDASMSLPDVSPAGRASRPD